MNRQRHREGQHERTSTRDGCDRRGHQWSDREQDARRLRGAFHHVRVLRPRRGQLGVRKPQWAQQCLPVAAHRHLQASTVLPRLPDARRLSRLSAPHADQAVPRRLHRRLRAAREDRVRQRRDTRATTRRWGMGTDDPARRDPPRRPARRGQRASLGPAASRFPRRVLRCADARTFLHRPPHAARALRQAHPRRRIG